MSMMRAVCEVDARGATRRASGDAPVRRQMRQNGRRESCDVEEECEMNLRLVIFASKLKNRKNAKLRVMEQRVEIADEEVQS